MKMNFHLISLITLYSLLYVTSSNAISSKDKPLIEAGCKKKKWDENGEYLDKDENKTFDWVASGKLLEKGACLEDGYRYWVVPQKGVTIVYSTIQKPFLRTIGHREQLVSIDYILTLTWIDKRIKTNFSLEYGTDETGMALRISTLKKIWAPELYIFHRSSFLDPYGTRSTVSLKLYSLQKFNELRRTNIKEMHANNDSTVVEYKSEYRSRIYCTFDYSLYPMDRHLCTLRLGSRSSSSTLMLQKDELDENIPMYSAAGFDIVSTLFDENINNGSNTFGVKMEMTRRLNPFLLKYYAPAIAVVIVSEISFLIPVAAIPGRIGLLVTLFLTLTNLFIHSMSDSPPGSELNALGIYLLVSLGFVVLAMIEFAIILLWSRAPRADIFGQKPFRKATSLFGSEKTASKKKQFGMSAMNFLDFLSFWCFLVCYVIFNCIYWITFTGNEI